MDGPQTSLQEVSLECPTGHGFGLRRAARDHTLPTSCSKGEERLSLVVLFVLFIYFFIFSPRLKLS